MPCATIHLLLADRVLEEWDRTPDRAPIRVAHPEVRAAFLHGALAPDMGFIPGVDRFVSELAHYVRPAELTRALETSATTEPDRAFAWGWATHVLGDVEIHPVVGRAVGERLYGDRSRRIDAEEDVATHVSTEVGLDIHFLLGHPGASKPPGSAHFDPKRVRHLSSALVRTYGLAWDSADLLRGHRKAVRMSRYWPIALRTLALKGGDDGAGARFWGVRSIARASLATITPITREGKPFRGFLTPAPPPDWMVREVESVIERFPDLVQEVVKKGLESIPERNLETGGPAGPGRGHPASDAAHRKLERLLGDVGAGGYPGVRAPG